jgi:Carboxypeptidase regulatory-like domain/TonB dependent receptor
MAIFARAARVTGALFLSCSMALASFGGAFAGTTGRINGTVTDANTGKPVADVQVSVLSPSQSASTITDSAGGFVFISLMPDTYVLSLEKNGYEPVSIRGLSVFADQSQSIPVKMQTSLKTIASVTSRSSISPVKPGTTTDVYSVNPAVTRAAAPVGGGADMNNAYSAIASMPGAYVPPDQTGVNQTVYIRGGNYDQIGYEYDGVPVNRSFDNYPSHTASTLGQQELQIYTGGGPASSNATGLSGFINQVVKTGTYPGSGTITGRIGTPTFDHELMVEAGGASPNRLFSYYVGLSGYNQQLRYLDQNNGAGVSAEFPQFWPSFATTNLSFWPAVYPTCNNNSLTHFYDNPILSSNTVALWNTPGCYDYLTSNIDLPAGVNGRETVANFHFGIPHKGDAGRDDIQLLYTNSYQTISSYNSPNELEPVVSLFQQDMMANGGNCSSYYASFDACDVGQLSNPPMWPDYYTFPSSTRFLQPANAQVVAYPFPGGPTNRCYNTGYIAADSVDIPVPNECPSGGFSPLSNTYRDGESYTASIVKLQYQKNIGSNAYLRLLGYTFYSTWMQNGAIGDALPSLALAGYRTGYDYEIGSHARGGQLQFVDQISHQHQITAAVNYVTSNTLRYNNQNDFNYGGAPFNDWTGSGGVAVSNLTNGTQCFAAYDANDTTALNPDANGIDVYHAGDVAPCNDPITQGSFDALTGNADYGPVQNQNCSGGSNAAIPAAACSAGASWRMTFLGNQADINKVTPKFTNISISDEWKPNERLDINASLRYEHDEYDLTPIAGQPGKDFWFRAAQNEYCYNPKTFQFALIPEPPQFLRDIQPYVTFNCPIDPSDGVQTVHPDGKNGHILFTDQFNPTYVQNYFSPRLGLTYTIDPNTVLRFSAGRYYQQPQTYQLEYDTAQQNLPALLVGFLQFGFNTPFHPANPQVSDNFDFSYEHQLPGTDIGLKLTPYYRWATNQIYSANVPTLALSPGFNSGIERTYGLELQLTKGDFNKNGFAAMFSYTYTNSKEKWANYPNSTINPVDPFNQDIAAFNALTKAGGGAPCYNGGDPESCPGPAAADYPDILNPYYNMSPQPMVDKFGWYDTGLDGPYVSPNVFVLLLNYKHDKFSITPALMLNQGASYGSPADFQGLDPRTCRQNQGPSGANIPSAPNPLTADYTSCRAAAIGASGTTPGYLFIPSPYTGKFDTFGQFKQPWQVNLGLQMRYDLSPRITLNATVANLYQRCFGGSSTPWTTIYPPDHNACSYYRNRFYISNFYNGSSPNDIAANGVPLNRYFSAAFAPSYDGNDVVTYNQVLPLQVYLDLQIKL